MNILSHSSSAEFIKKTAFEIGFDMVGCVDASNSAYGTALNFYSEWISRGMHSEMEYLKNHNTIKSCPDNFLSDAQSVVVVGAIYASGSAADYEKDDNTLKPLISKYAHGPDYHEIMEKKLNELIEKISDHLGGAHRLFVDRHPVMDRTWATLGGLGWIGKNTCVINRKAGSFFFIGGFFSTLKINADRPATDHCGRCRLCIDACPTHAILEPKQTGLNRHVIQSDLCISYQTIENRGEIPSAIQNKMGSWVVGCDICQQVCPWNRQRGETMQPRQTWFKSQHSLASLTYEEGESLTASDWKSRVKGSAISRLKYQQFIRNLKIAKKNSSSE